MKKRAKKPAKDETFGGSQLSEVCADNLDDIVTLLIDTNQDSEWDKPLSFQLPAIDEYDPASKTYDELFHKKGLGIIVAYVREWIADELSNINACKERRCEHETEDDCYIWTDERIDYLESQADRLEGEFDLPHPPNFQEAQHWLAALRIEYLRGIVRDDPDTDEEAWYIEMKGHFLSLADYCAHRSVAADARLKGRIQEALSEEAIADSVYKSLPDWAKW